MMLTGATQGFAQSDEGKTFESDVVKLRGKIPVGIKQAPPEYPYAMARAGLIGQVALEFIIDQQGRVQNPYVISSKETLI